ncbi:MAG TPA: ABC transporter permease [Bryobacteraceae bacterium]|nr:ABC transporter permease [Bryobacteraceae bacterium]
MSPVEWSRDLRLALRLLAKNPGATALAVLSIALGIGLTTGLFAVGDAALLRPLPVERPQELWSVNSRGDDGNWMMYGWADYLDMAKALEGRAQVVATRRRGVQVGEGSDLVIIQAASANYFRVVGVKAALGRASLGEAAGRPETVLGYRLWQTRFASDPRIVGKTVLLNHKAFLVAGVLPEAFTGLQRGLLVGVWVGPDGWFSTLGHREEMQSRNDQFEIVAAIPRPPDGGTRRGGTGRRHSRPGKAQTRARQRFGNIARILCAAVGVRPGVRRRHCSRAGVGPVRGLCQRRSVAAGAGRSAPQGIGRADRLGRGRLASRTSVVGGDRSAHLGGRRTGTSAGPVSDGEGVAVRTCDGFLFWITVSGWIIACSHSRRGRSFSPFW